MAYKLQLKEKKILHELDLDARKSNIQIAKKLRLSKNVVNYQINKLEEQEIIKGYHSLFDFSKLGLSLFRVYFDFYEFDQEKENQLIEFLIDSKITGFVAKTVGNWDLVVSFYVKSDDEFLDHWFKILKQFRDVIKEYNTNLIVKEFFFRRAYLTTESKDKSNSIWVRGGNEKVEIDDKDREIIRFLTKDSRIPLTKISQGIGLGSMGTIYRLKNLAKTNVLIGSRADLNFAKLGYEYYKVVLQLEEINAFKSIFSYCQMHPNITSVTKTISSNVDMEFDLEIEDFNMFIELIDQLKKMFPKAVRDYKYLKFINFKKTAYLPL
ncbi:hypothetical protein COY27_02240 [Candidatus Woesearchaeota archaeon CG_4_10_14_0_2_um_filter_33_13]|nr:MAG: hypothetical protein COY27_02240 [Candidatus Woesearchaeota archaeon CG_4_10_14_0_2_um_filter_33_13]